MSGSRYAKPYTEEDILRFRAWAEVAKMRHAFEDAPACQICGEQPTPRKPLRGHHWRGYEYPRDVWWICQSCHKRLGNMGIEHDGKVSLEEARRLLYPFFRSGATSITLAGGRVITLLPGT